MFLKHIISNTSILFLLSCGLHDQVSESYTTFGITTLSYNSLLNYPHMFSFHNLAIVCHTFLPFSTLWLISPSSTTIRTYLHSQKFKFFHFWQVLPSPQTEWWYFISNIFYIALLSFYCIPLCFMNFSCLIFAVIYMVFVMKLQYIFYFKQFMTQLPF